MNTNLVPIFDYRPVHWPRARSQGRGFTPGNGRVECRGSGVADAESDEQDITVWAEADTVTSLADTVPFIEL